MNFLKKAFLWLLMFTKRLYKKPTFLAILLLIPLLTLGYQSMTKEDTGMLTIVLSQEAEDPITEEIFANLQENSQLFRYIICQNPAEAEALVQTGKADVAWIFPGNMMEHIKAYLEDPDGDTAIVKVIQREQNVALLLAQEKLNGEIFSYISQQYYLSYTRQEWPALADLSDEELLQYYHDVEGQDGLFDYDTVAGRQAEDIHYLLSPVRGLLAVVMALCGLATAMYHLKDRENGTFSWVPERRQMLPELGSQVVAVLNVGIVVLIALVTMGLSQNIFLELITLVVSVLCVASFSMMIRSLIGSVRYIGAILPLLIIAMLLVCPVFLDFGAFRPWQLLLPPTYFINAPYNTAYLLYGLLYCLANFSLYSIFRKLFKG